MCGIAGFIGQGDEAVLRTMTDCLKRRGPDDQGFFVKDGVGLGHRRLSIIDVSGGGQPIYNEDKTVVVVFNGEIYNFQKLRGELSSQGHRFYTKTDTEILVHLYEESGEGFLEKLNGMFALALWDAKRRKLILARDRLGEKPLHYAVISQALIFGSELKAILEHPLIKREIDFFALAKYLLYEFVPAPQTIFRNIYKLEPGEYAVYENNSLKKNKYWEVGFSSKFNLPRRGVKAGVKSSKLSEREIIESLETELERAVKERLIADVPLGVWLSGGIDSTTIAYFAQKNSSRPIKTFSIGFGEPSFDESKYARQAASFLGAEHHERIIEARDCLELIPQITDFLDEPMADGSIVPTFLLAKFTGENVKVTLGGDGGDELFMGYPTFQAHQIAKFYRKLPLFLRNKIIAPLANRLPASLSNISFDFKLKRFISGFEYPPEIRNQIWLGSFRPDELKNIFTTEVYQSFRSQDIFEDITNRASALVGEPLENRLIYLYLKHYLQDDILVKTDRASMAVGLETRAPFLDHQFVELVNSLPSSLKLRGWTTKYIFKKMMAGKLPKDIIYRPKKGFGMPIGRWLREDLRELAKQLFAPEKIAKEGIFNPTIVNQLLSEHLSGKKDHRKPLWTLMIFEMWLEKWA